jgi:trehalose 6-phosphate synthase
LDEIGNRKAFVWFQDFHLSLAPRMLKERRPDVVCAHFWHIPWPQNEIFRACPWKNEILKGLLANDLLGFHTRSHCNNFLETVDRNIEAKTDRATYSVSLQGLITHVMPFPISVDFDYISKLSDMKFKRGVVEHLRKKHQLHDKKVILGVERIDYTKGIPEKLKAYDWFLRKYPQYIGKVVYLQIGSPSRVRLVEYRGVTEEIEELVDDINWRHGTDRWSPIIYMPTHHDFDEIVAYYRLADYCIVSSLHDGMNLVAKEYLAAKTDNSGMLILSKFTGGAQELGKVVHVNPYDTKSFLKSIRKIIKMDNGKKSALMADMREWVRENNIYFWASNVISNLRRVA